MSILSLIIAIVVVGVLLWLINSYIPLDQKVKNILNVVVIILLVIWILKVVGAWSYLAGMEV